MNIESILQDVRVAIRSLRRKPGFVIAAGLTLAVGIAANTVLFTLANVILFRTPPAATDPASLYWLTETSRDGAGFRSISYPSYVAYRDRLDGFSGILAYHGVDFALGGATPERIHGEIVSGNYFDVLGVRPSAGRTFRADEDAQREVAAVAVISDALWRRRFAASPRIVDSTITLNGRAFTVVGVAPPGFGGVNIESGDLWVPIAMQATVMPTFSGFLDDPGALWLDVLGRLAPGATPEQAAAAASVIVHGLDAARSDSTNRTAVLVTPVAGSIDPANRGQTIPMLAVLSLVPLLVLGVACANVANLQLARALGRRRELAMRRALGATRGRLVRQLVTESVILSLIGCLGAIALAAWATGLVAALVNLPPVFAGLQPDMGVFIATAALAVGTGVIFGLAPALSVTRQDLTPALKNESVTLRLGGNRHRLRDTFVVAQIALSLVLLIGAGLFLRSLGKATRVDPGFERHGAVVASFDPSLEGYTDERRAAFVERLVTQLAAVPGVSGAATTSALAFSGRMYGTPVSGEGTDARNAQANFAAVTPGFLAAMQTRLLRGRAFDNRDNAGAAPVVIVNETLARRLWPDSEAVGRRFRSADDGLFREVIGVVQDGRYKSLAESPLGFFYIPEAQTPSASYLTVVMRGDGDPAALIAAVRRTFASLDPNMPLFDVMTLEGSMANALMGQRAASWVLGVAGFVGLVLAALGIFGVTSQGVTLRTREIGIRMSLGARAADVLGMFVREGLILSVIGVGIGLALSLALSRVLGTFLFGLAATDAPTFAVGAVGLSLVAAVASYIPARRAARVDPMVALRSE